MARAKKVNSRNFVNDRISNLPCHVIENIFNRLPLRDAARTSILSRDWRYKWLTIPNLVFDSQLGNNSGLPLTREKVEFIVYQVLLFHKGPIHKFKLNLIDFGLWPAFTNWIRLLLNHQIRELYVNLSSYPDERYHPLPFYLFKFEHLSYLFLSGCEFFEPPLSFRGFASLVKLELDDVRIVPKKFSGFISNYCPLLEHLRLDDCPLFGEDDFFSCEIDAPNLKSLHVYGFFRSISFINTPLLAKVSIILRRPCYNWQESNLLEVFGHFSSLVRLEFNCFALEYLFIGGVPEELPHSFKHLKAFHFSDIDSQNFHDVSCIFCLIRSSPNLESLEITLEAVRLEGEQINEVLQFFKAQEKCGNSLNQLKNVKIRFFTGSETEMEFVKLLLTTATTLEKLEIVPEHSSETKELLMVKDLTRLRRASSKAEIIFY